MLRSGWVRPGDAGRRQLFHPGAGPSGAVNHTGVIHRYGGGVSEPAASAEPAVPDGRLSDRDRDVLLFERQWWRYAGAKEHAIRERFDMSSTRYYQVLNALIDRQDALAFDPLLVKRLRRMRQTRQRARSARRLGLEP